VRALGIRQRRRLARHVAHCQPCRRFAHLAGVDDSVLKGPGLAEKIAAILPIPAFLRWRRGPSDEQTTSTSGSHSFGVPQSMPRVAQFVDPALPAVGFGRATAAVVAAVVVAGGGVVSTLATAGGTGTTNAKHAVPAQLRVAPGAPPTLSSPRQSTAGTAPGSSGARANGAAVTSGGQSGGAPQSQSSTGQPTSPNASSSGPPASESHSGLATDSSNKTPSSNTNPSQNSSSQTPSQPGLPQLPKLPLPQGGSLPSLPQLPPINPPQLPQLNLPSVPSVGNLLGTVQHKLLP
jgi:hypothetical protein